jgi:hypothetical protein
VGYIFIQRPLIKENVLLFSNKKVAKLIDFSQLLSEDRLVRRRRQFCHPPETKV